MIDLETLKAEADKLGYYLQKKPTNPGRLIKCCGRLPRRPYYPDVIKKDGKFIDHWFVKCDKCGERVDEYYTCPHGLRKDEIRAAIGRKWNEMIEKELTDDKE